MNLRNLVSEFAFRRLKNKKADSFIEKDIDIFLEYFGLKSNKVPTFQSVAESHGVSRQFIEQKISQQFRPFVTDQDKQKVKPILDYLSDKTLVSTRNLFDDLRRIGSVDSDFHIFGVLNLLREFGQTIDFGVYNFEINEATRNDFLNRAELLVIAKSEVESVRMLVKRIRTAPGVRGLAYLEPFTENESKMSLDLLEYIVAGIDNSWMLKAEGKTWYMFEDRENVLVNSLGKMKTQVKSIDIVAASNILHSVLDARTSEYEYPSSAVIEKYLERSRFLTKNQNAVVFGESLESPTLSTSDEVVIQHFLDSQDWESSFVRIEPLFIDYGFSRPNASRHSYHSPFILVDRSGGRKNFKLLFIKKFESVTQHSTDRYTTFKIKLQRYQNQTDIDAETKVRTEQSILRDFLFEDRDELDCALCGYIFSIKSLVTAHKKKRSRCTENERTDPSIVWPLCKFGCDYLYQGKRIIGDCNC